MAVQSVADPRQALLESLNVAREKTSDSKLATEDRFLTLLTTQLRNQDPLNPLDNAQVTSQLAQISTVDGIERLNRTLQTLMTASNDNQALQAAAIVGHGVLVQGGSLLLGEGNAIGGVDLKEPADRVAVEIRDANGLLIRTLNLGALEAGSHAFRWDGLSDNGSQAVDGTYSIKAAAVRGDAAVGIDALQLGVVGSVVRAADGMRLNVGGLGEFKLGEVRQIL